MNESIYKPPNSKLDHTEIKKLSAAERLAQSRKEMEESAAIEKLNIIWGLRLAFDLLICGISFLMIYESFSQNDYKYIVLSIILLVFFTAEIISIVGYFKRKKWCVIPLHIFAAISLASIPVGTILSILHYINMGKIEFNKKIE